MKFYDHPNHWALFKNSGLADLIGAKTPEDMYFFLSTQSRSDHPGVASLSARHAWFDERWTNLGKPYYDVYPSIIPMLTNLNLDIPGNQITPPHGLKDLVLRLPECNHSLQNGSIKVRTLFISFQECSKAIGSEVRGPGLVVGLDLGERDSTCQIPMFTMRVFPTDDRSLEKTMKSLHDFTDECDGIKVPIELIDDCVRLCLTVCLLGDNEELVQPQVLNKDILKWNDADLEKRKSLIEKAKRRGKFGFSLGEELENKGSEKSPHYRRPHLAIVWTGQGRTTLKTVMRKGALVHRDKINKIPTGYLDAIDDQHQT